MTASFSLDTSQLDRLAADLGKVPARTVAPVAAAVREAATAIRDDLRQVAALGSRSSKGLADGLSLGADGKVRDGRGRFVSHGGGSGRLPAFPKSITADVRGLSAEIGPDKNLRQGALGNILYFGTAKTVPVLEHPSRALQRQADPFATAVQDAATAALGEALQ